MMKGEREREGKKNEKMSSPDYLYFARPIGVQITLGWPLSISGT
jgi:hypothetical protein